MVTVEWSLPPGYTKHQFADVVDDMLSTSKPPHVKSGRVHMNVSSTTKTISRFDRSFTITVENIFGQVRIVVS